MVEVGLAVEEPFQIARGSADGASDIEDTVTPAGPISLANSTGIVSSKPALLLLVRFALFLIVLDGVDIVSG